MEALRPDGRFNCCCLHRGTVHTRAVPLKRKFGQQEIIRYLKRQAMTGMTQPKKNTACWKITHHSRQVISQIMPKKIIFTPLKYSVVHRPRCQNPELPTPGTCSRALKHRFEDPQRTGRPEKAAGKRTTKQQYLQSKSQDGSSGRNRSSGSSTVLASTGVHVVPLAGERESGISGGGGAVGDGGSAIVATRAESAVREAVAKPSRGSGGAGALAGTGGGHGGGGHIRAVELGRGRGVRGDEVLFPISLLMLCPSRMRGRRGGGKERFTSP